MTTIAGLIDQLAQSPRGRIFLVNLKTTLDDGFDPQPLRKVCQDLATSLQPGSDGKLDSAGLADQLGGRCVNCGLWRQASVPDRTQYAGGRGLVFSRVMTYGQFYTRILGRAGTMPPIAGWDLPRMDLERERAGARFPPEYVPTVRQFIDSGAWKRYPANPPPVGSGTHCVWLLPLAALARREAANRRPLADFYRDVIGLSHIPAGRHLVRLDFDFNAFDHEQRLACRRPHGAGNGGDRFRMAYDGPVYDNWGRTVHLGVVAARRGRASMNGVPEVLMEPFDAPREAVEARYIGEVGTPAERNDSWFLGRISPKPFETVVSSLKQVLA